MFFPFLNGGRDPSNIALRMPPQELACISQEKEWRNSFRKRQRVMKEFPPKKIKHVMQVIFRNCGFVRFPAFGTVSGQHLECVQRFLFVLFLSHVLRQSFSNSRFWLKESDFGLNKWCQICFWTKLQPQPALDGCRKESYTKRAETTHFSKFA